MRIANNGQTAILERIVRPRHAGMSVAAAESILQLKFGPVDIRRMKHLLEVNQSGELSLDEANELEDYRNVGRLVDLMQSQARHTLARRNRK